MAEPWTSKWNERYAQKEFAYGEQPNNFLKEQLADMAPGTILFPADGEGRNSVFAASLGWKAYAFDISAEGKNKALQLAAAKGVTVNYHVGDLQSLPYHTEQFDAIAFIYAHFPADVKSTYHRTLDQYLRKGGTVIFEAFSKKHLAYNSANPAVGGPKEIDVLFSEEEIAADFKNYDVVMLEETVIELAEGLYHNGKGAVIRFVGRKRS